MEYSFRSAHRLTRKPKRDLRFVENIYEEVATRLTEAINPDLMEILRFALSGPDGSVRISVAALARHLGISPRTLAQHLSAEQRPPARDLLASCLVLRAANYLCHTELTVETVAERVGLSGAHALRRMFRRYLERPPRDFHDHQQWDGIVRTFVGRL